MAHIHQKLLISAPVDKVFQAITTQEGLAGWWTPEATAQPTVNTVARFPFGPSYFKEMKITELIPQRLVKWLCISGDKQCSYTWGQFLRSLKLFCETGVGRPGPINIILNGWHQNSAMVYKLIFQP
jgi:hypothetical protein